MVTIIHVHISTLFIYVCLVTKYVNTEGGTKEDPDSSHRTGHRLNSITYIYIYAFHRSVRLSLDNRMWNMSKTYKSVQDI